MSEPRVQVAIITGSTREGRFGPVVGRWFADRAALREDVTVDEIDLAEVGLPAVLPKRPNPAAQRYVDRIGRADAFVLVTPEYNHGYPASLKQAIDLPRAEWRAKPVGFVSYGGMGGGLRAVEQLRQVFPEVQATTVRDTVSFPNFWERFDGSGRLLDPEAPERAATTMLDQLVWWGRALRVARLGDRRRTEAA